MLGLIDYEAAIHLWKIDKFDFLVCFSAYFGVVFGSVEIGLIIAVYHCAQIFILSHFVFWYKMLFIHIIYYFFCDYAGYNICT